MIRIAIDLELESDGVKTGRIIQLGYTIFDTKNGDIIYAGGDYIKVDQPLHSFIIGLTKITDEDLTGKGIDITSAYKNMLNKFKQICIQEESKTNNQSSEPVKNKEQTSFYQIIEWGSGDVKTLKKELLESGDIKFEFGEASLNVKAVFQMMMIAKNQKFSGGLGRSLKKLGLNFESYKEEVAPGYFRQRGAHNAISDSLNTAKIYLALQEKMK